MRCAPRELAIAQSELEFAELDEAQGELANAWSHLAVAQPNAQAAILLSPSQRCRGQPDAGAPGSLPNSRP